VKLKDFLTSPEIILPRPEGLPFVKDAKRLAYMGKAMHLVAGVGRVVVVMDHTGKHGESKVLHRCTLPLTGKGVVNRIITNLGVLEVVPGGLRIVQCAEGVTEADLRAATKATLVP
jgi:3-oxoacid CoA-transferase subunit B